MFPAWVLIEKHSSGWAYSHQQNNETMTIKYFDAVTLWSKAFQNREETELDQTKMDDLPWDGKAIYNFLKNKQKKNLLTDKASNHTLKMGGGDYTFK